MSILGRPKYGIVPGRRQCYRTQHQRYNKLLTSNWRTLSMSLLSPNACLLMKFPVEFDNVTNCDHSNCDHSNFTKYFRAGSRSRSTQPSFRLASGPRPSFYFTASHKAMRHTRFADAACIGRGCFQQWSSRAKKSAKADEWQSSALKRQCMLCHRYRPAGVECGRSALVALRPAAAKAIRQPCRARSSGAPVAGSTPRSLYVKALKGWLLQASGLFRDLTPCRFQATS